MNMFHFIPHNNSKRPWEKYIHQLSEDSESWRKEGRLTRDLRTQGTQQQVAWWWFGFSFV